MFVFALNLRSFKKKKNLDHTVLLVLECALKEHFVSVVKSMPFHWGAGWGGRGVVDNGEQCYLVTRVRIAGVKDSIMGLGKG